MEEIKVSEGLQIERRPNVFIKDAVYWTRMGTCTDTVIRLPDNVTFIGYKRVEHYIAASFIPT